MINDTLGNLAFTCKPGRILLITAIVVFILFTAASVFICFTTILPIDGVHFSGDVFIIYKTIALLMGIGILLLSVAIYLSKKPIFSLYQNGIVSSFNAVEKKLYFDEIKDIYPYASGKKLFMPNNIMFRGSDQDSWQVISPDYSNNIEALDFIIDQHASQYTPKIVEQLKNGEEVTFHYMNLQQKLLNQFFVVSNKSFQNIDSKSFRLFKDKIIKDDNVYHFDDFRRITLNTILNTINFINYEGKIVLSFTHTLIFSRNTFMDAIREFNKEKVEF